MEPQALDFLRQAAASFGGKAAIVGKGPSFHELSLPDTAQERFVIGLNEVALQAGCHAGFVIDADILEAHARALRDLPLQALLVPRVSHRKTRTVGQLAIYQPKPEDASDTWVRDLAPKLKRFNLSTSQADPTLGPVVQAYNFSAPTLAHLLGEAGFKDILLAGVDGGTQYADTFSDFEYKKLKSVQSDFDVQFADLRLVKQRFGLRLSSVRCRQAWILIGAEPEQSLATEVLKWSIESNTILDVQYCDATHVARDLYVSGSAGTPFSFQRLFLPQMAGRSGRGMYFDSDMLVMKDVFAVFNTDMQDKVLLGCEPTPGRRVQYSVFLVDNERAAWDPADLVARYRAGEISYETLMREFAFADPRASTLPMQWNSLEIHEPGRTANIHFTDMGTQPWLSVYNPNAALWCESLFAAAAQRPAVQAALEESLARGWVRPSLRWQMENRHANPWTLPHTVSQADRDWLPPHAEARASKQPRSLQLLKWRLASRLRRMMQSRNYVRFVRARQALRKAL